MLTIVVIRVRLRIDQKRRASRVAIVARALQRGGSPHAQHSAPSGMPVTPFGITTSAVSISAVFAHRMTAELQSGIFAVTAIPPCGINAKCTTGIPPMPAGPPCGIYAKYTTGIRPAGVCADPVRLVWVTAGPPSGMYAKCTTGNTPTGIVRLVWAGSRVE